jgi:hypothetical protein
MPVHVANWWKNQCNQYLVCSCGWLRVQKMVGYDRICVGSYFTILIANLCMQDIFKKLIPWILMIEHDENQLNVVVKPFARNQNVWEFREINYCGWWNVGLCLQSKWGVIEHKMCVLIFWTTFVWNNSYSKKNWAR